LDNEHCVYGGGGKFREKRPDISNLQAPNNAKKGEQNGHRVYDLAQDSDNVVQPDRKLVLTVSKNNPHSPSQA